MHAVQRWPFRTCDERRVGGYAVIEMKERYLAMVYASKLEKCCRRIYIGALGSRRQSDDDPRGINMHGGYQHITTLSTTLPSEVWKTVTDEWVFFLQMTTMSTTDADTNISPLRGEGGMENERIGFFPFFLSQMITMSTTDGPTIRRPPIGFEQ